TKRGTLERRLAGSFFDQLRISRQLKSERRQRGGRRSQRVRVQATPRSDDERSVEAERRNEVHGLELPVWKDTVVDLEAQRHPLDTAQKRLRVLCAKVNRLTEPEDDLGLDLWRHTPGNRHPRFAIRRIDYRVVVHARPDQRLELQDAPHRLVRVTDLAPDTVMASGKPKARDLRLDRICRGHVEAGIA